MFSWLCYLVPLEPQYPLFGALSYILKRQWYIQYIGLPLHPVSEYSMTFQIFWIFFSQFTAKIQSRDSGEKFAQRRKNVGMIKKMKCFIYLTQALFIRDFRVSVFWECSLLKDSKCKMGSLISNFRRLSYTIELGFDLRKRQIKWEFRKYLTSLSRQYFCKRFNNLLKLTRNLESVLFKSHLSFIPFFLLRCT